MYGASKYIATNTAIATDIIVILLVVKKVFEDFLALKPLRFLFSTVPSRFILRFTALVLALLLPRFIYITSF